MDSMWRKQRSQSLEKEMRIQVEGTGTKGQEINKPRNQYFVNILYR